MPNIYKKKWIIKDLIDLDYFLYLRKKNLSNEDFTSDRNFYQEKMSSAFNNVEKGKYSQKDIIYGWLEANRSVVSNTKLPGECYESSFKIIFLIFSFFAFFSGFSAVFAFLSYTGSSPINVFYFFTLFAGIQFLFLPFALIPFFTGSKEKIIRKIYFFSPVYILLKTVAAKSAEKLRKKYSSEKFNKFSYPDFTKYKEPSFWLIFTSVQWILVLFSAGVVFGTFLKVLGSDLAFGWQTTLNTGPEYIQKIVDIISYPWAWIVPESLAAPSIEEIKGSKIVLKDGMAALSTSHMVSWWPFLCFSVIFYALIPRLLVMFAACFFYLKALKKYPLDSSELRQLLRFLLRPEVGFAENDEITEKKINAKESSFSGRDIENKGISKEKLPGIKLIVPEDIYLDYVFDFLEKKAVKKFGYLDGPVFKSSGVMEIDKPEFNNNPEFLNDKSQSLFMICFEAWQPPVKQSIDYLVWLRDVVGKQSEIVVVLIGKPTEKGFLKVTENDYILWASKINKIKDPLISIFKLNPE